MPSPAFFKRSALTRTLWHFRREFALVGLLSLLANVLMLTPTLYMLQVYDRVLTSQSELTLMAISLITVALLAVMAAAEWLRSRLLVATGVRLDAALGTQVFNASFDAHLDEAGSSASKAFGDLLQIRQFITGNGVFAFFDTPWVPIYIAVLFFLHPWLGWLGVGFGVIQLSLALFTQRSTRRPTEAALAAQSDAQVFLQNKLRQAEVLQAMGMLGALRTRWQARHSLALEANGHAQHLQHRLAALSKFVRYTQQSASLGLGGLLAIQGDITPGAMIAANVLTTRALAPIDLLVAAFRPFIAMRDAFGRLERLLAEYPQRDPNLHRLAPAGHVQLRAVTATASGRDQPILAGLDLDLPAGRTLAVLGPSGSGKSTLARVMLGIWPQVAGEVLLDERPIAGWDRTELGAHLGYLPQDIELFEGTIADNIARFGAVDAERVIAAARMTDLHETILRFPKGYDTPIGEAGNLLSGGQRQRIGLARAVYGEPRLIVLDEPNANLDDAGEAALMHALQRLKAAGRSVVLITHRPAALAVADDVLLLQGGRCVAHGPRDAVLAALRASAAPSASNPVSPTQVPPPTEPPVAPTSVAG